MNIGTSPVQAVRAPQRVLIAVDGSTASAHALAYAKALLPSNAAVHVVSVAENPRTLVPLGSKTMAFLESARVELLRNASDALSRAKAALDRDDLVIDTEVVDLAAHGGDVVNALADSVQTWHAELLIVGARQHHGLLGWVEGTVSGPLGKLVGCPLLIVPEGFASVAEHGPRRMLFAVDGSEIALDALRTGLTFSRADTEFRAIYVVDPPNAGRLRPWRGTGRSIDRRRKSCTPGCHGHTRRHGQTCAVVTHSRRSNRRGRFPSDRARRTRMEWDMIVMGTHGRRGVTGWLVGSVAGRVARITKTPVLLVHASRA